MGRLWKKITDHPIISGAITLWGLVAASWSLFTDKKIPTFLADKWWVLAMAPWYYTFIGVVFCVAVGFYIALIRAVRATRKEAGQFETLTGERNTARRTIEEMQARLSTLESKQPHLKTEPYIIQRKRNSWPPTQMDPIGCFALLRVTNEPKNFNSQSIAYRLYAKVSYCNEHWIDLFLPVSGAWFSLYPAQGPDTIAPPNNKLDKLEPHQSAYLGIALRYQRSPLQCHALSESSGEWPDWFNPELMLSGETTYVKVTIGCSGFQTTDYYVLEEAPETGLQLQSVPDPTSLSSDIF